MSKEKSSLVIEQDNKGRTVALYTHITPELFREYIVNELSSIVMELRKKDKCELTDVCNVLIATANPHIVQAIVEHTITFANRIIANRITVHNTETNEKTIVYNDDTKRLYGSDVYYNVACNVAENNKLKHFCF